MHVDKTGDVNSTMAWEKLKKKGRACNLCVQVHSTAKPLKSFGVLILVAKLDIDDTSRTKYCIRSITPIFSTLDNAGIALFSSTPVACSMELAIIAIACHATAFLARLIHLFKTNGTEITITLDTKVIMTRDTRTTVRQCRLVAIVSAAIVSAAGVTANVAFASATWSKHLLYAGVLFEHCCHGGETFPETRLKNPNVYTTSAVFK